MEIIRSFRELSKNDGALAGGKGASLGEMTRAGIPVPPGFVILANAFERFLDETDLNVEIDAALHEVNHKEMHTVERAAETIKGLILAAETPKDIAAEIKKHFKKLGTPYVAVRSSATAEDSAKAAWAGQLESYLNTTEKNLLENVKKCWASLFTPRAIFYRFEKNLHRQKISVAVVVQKMVESEVSGIAFSVHPVTQDRNQLIIEAGFGLGEAIVSGQITPDSYVVEKHPRRIIDKNIVVQNKSLIRANKGGVAWREIPEKKGKMPALTDAQILKLAELVLKIETHYNFPCDIEWAYEKGKFSIVQSRPITTLNGQLTAPTSLTQQFLSAVGDDLLFKAEADFLPLLVMIDWFNYYDETGRIKNVYPAICFTKGPTGTLYWSLTKYRSVSKMMFRRYLDRSFNVKQFQERYEILQRDIDKLYYGYYRNARHTEASLLQKLKEAHNLLREVDLQTLFLDALDRQTIVETLEEKNVAVNLSEIWRVSHMVDSNSFHIKNKEDILRQYKKQPESLQYIYSGYSGILSKADTRKKVKSLSIAALKREVERNRREAADGARIKSQASKKLTRTEQLILQFVDWTGSLRDERKAFVNKCDVLLYNITRELYRLWNIDEKLVPVSLVMDVVQGKKHVRSLVPALRQRINGTALLLNEGGVYQEAPETDAFAVETVYRRQHAAVDAVLRGETASPGIVSGKVRIVIRAREFADFQEGEILVTSMTRPEFVPLMKKAAAIVTDEGGITSHAAIVSRELHKPCIIGTRIATSFLKTGDEVEVDADRGVVRVLEKHGKS